MSNKSEATWHPNHGPVADFNATLARIDHLKAERDEARAERDALAYVIEQARRVSTPVVQSSWRDRATEVDAILYASTAESDLARHNAEVKAQALDEAAAAGLTRNDHEGYAIGVCDCGNLDEKVARGLLRDRAAAIRAEAE